MTKNSPDRRSLRLSVILHSLVFVSLGLFFLIKSCVPKRDFHVFELTEIKPELTSKIANNSFPNTSKPSVEKTSVKPIAEKIDYETFLKLNPKNQRVRPQEPIQQILPKIKLDPRLKTESFKTDRNSESELQAYQRYLYETINLNWKKPNLNRSELYVVVEFTVQKNGKIQYFEILESSGDLSLDQSVRSVFEKIQSFNEPPNRQSHRFKMTFGVAL